MVETFGSFVIKINKSNSHAAVPKSVCAKGDSEQHANGYVTFDRQGMTSAET